MQETSEFPKNILNQCLEPAVLNAMAGMLDLQEKANIIKGAEIIADIFGATPIFNILTEDPSAQRDTCENNLVSSFHSNLTLLVQKTWVEKYDEALKDQALYQLDKICVALNEKAYADMYEEYLSLLHDVVYLMFGPLSKKDDFAEYALRIDPEFGVFWWLLQNVSAQIPEDLEIGRLYILLGMFFLANY